MTAAPLPVPDPAEFFAAAEARSWGLIHGMVAAHPAAPDDLFSDDERETIRLGIAAAITSTVDELLERDLLRKP